jgi:DNA-directed RNA polymerase subunit RPC12/RpoP
MPDREKVIKGLEELSSFLFREYRKAHAEETNIYYDRFLAVEDALSILKEQNAEKPIAKEDDTFECCTCGAIVGWDELDASGIVQIRCNYCSFCGKPVKWE